MVFVALALAAGILLLATLRARSRPRLRLYVPPAGASQAEAAPDAGGPAPRLFAPDGVPHEDLAGK